MVTRCVVLHTALRLFLSLVLSEFSAMVLFAMPSRVLMPTIRLPYSAPSYISSNRDNGEWTDSTTVITPEVARIPSFPLHENALN
ncbi:hypothetical protein V8F33_011944 [Rhypophila sp. PSN 637]